MNASDVLRPLERRVTASYLIAFAAVLVVFVSAVHLAFATDLSRDTHARLAALVGEGRMALEAKHGRLHIDSDALQLIGPAVESISYDDRHGHLVTRIGSLDPARAEVATTIVVAPLLRLAIGVPPATITAAVDLTSSERLIRRVDWGLGLGFVLALLAAGIGGRILANRSVARVVATVRTLRDFTADAAHELRGPLAAISSNASASLRDDREIANVDRKRFETIVGAAHAMTRIVDDLLLLARAETPIERDLFVVDLDERVAAVTDARRSLAAERAIVLDVRPFRARVYGNPSEIDRVVGNLIDNAIRYTLPGGRVDVSGESERGGIALRVRDTGVGVSTDDQRRIFERFWRADSARNHENGSGLGLAIARALARRHGGDVTVVSRLGDGSEFCFWLPMKPPQPEFHEISTLRT